MLPPGHNKPWTPLLMTLCIYTSLQSISQPTGILPAFLGAPSTTGTCRVHSQQPSNLEKHMDTCPMGNAGRNPQAMDWDAVLKLFYSMHCINDGADLKSSILILPLGKNL